MEKPMDLSDASDGLKLSSELKYALQAKFASADVELQM